jgi:hypothetical protein
MANPLAELFIDNIKRMYKGYKVEYWGSKDFIIIHIPMNPEIEFNFNLHPIIALLGKYDKSLNNFNLFRDPKRGISVVRIGIKYNMKY